MHFSCVSSVGALSEIQVFTSLLVFRNLFLYTACYWYLSAWIVLVYDAEFHYKAGFNHVYILLSHDHKPLVHEDKAWASFFLHETDHYKVCALSSVIGVMISGKETLLLRVFFSLFVLGKTSPFIPQSLFTYLGLGHSGSRLSRIFHTSFCPVTLSSSSWGDPQVSQARQDTLYNPSSEFCELNMPRISPIQVRSCSIILVVWQLYGWCLQSSATYTKTTHMNK